MKTKLLSLLLFCGFQFGFAQTPVITGDLILCPNTSGTAVITGDVTYDSYTWYAKYWFTNDDFVEITGANGASFTYDWDSYDQKLIKVVVTRNGDTFESNELQIDSYNWAGMTTMYDSSKPNIFIPTRLMII